MYQLAGLAIRATDVDQLLAVELAALQPKTMKLNADVVWNLTLLKARHQLELINGNLQSPS
jgi:hypothetical protein